MSVLNNSLLLGADLGGYQIQRSLRFNSSDSAYLSRTPASAGNRKTWTWSGWVKRSALTANNYFFGCETATTQSGSLYFSFDAGAFNVLSFGFFWRTTTAVFRDPSAWFHLVVAVDTTESTANNRIRIYFNGVEQTSFSTLNNPTQNADLGINQAAAHVIGDYKLAGNLFYSGYLADIHFIDGQALTPSSFAETNITTGQWVPKAYTGTYGTNGFRLAFADNSNNTATTLGKDSSPNGNNWTPNNLSVTAGAGNDSLVDTPTSYGTDTGAGGEVRGNYCTLNQINKAAANISLADGNLQGTTTFSTGIAYATIGVSTGKWYWEVVGTANTEFFIGIGKEGGLFDARTANGFAYYSGGTKWTNNTGSAYGASYTTNDVIGVALNMDAGTLTFYKNGVSQGTAFSGLSGTYFPNLQNAGNVTATYVFNFGQRQWAYAAPAGFKALCDTNLPAPVVAKPNSVFDVALWTGNGSARSITGLNFNPDFVWIKGRSGATDHALYDVVRGTEKRLESNTTDAEVTSDGGVTAFNSDGFSLGTLAQVNTNSSTYVGWAFDAGSNTVSNTAGSITSQVRANASAGFSIVTWTGDGAASASVGHGLGVAPRLYLTKCRDSIGGVLDNWGAFTTATGSMLYGFLNTTAAFGTPSQSAPTSTTINVVSAFENVSGKRFVAYCFAPVAGYSSFGSYTGNGSTDGPFVYTGFRPALVIVKMSSSTGNWTILDYQRQGYNVDNDPLFPNLANTEGTTDLLDLTSNGFKVRTTDATFNTNAGTYVYAAWAQNPYQYARAR